MKNCVVHDSPNTLIGSANLTGKQRCSLEFYGNEIYHGGQGNTKHNFYLHRGHDGSFVRVVFINNYCHSARGSIRASMRLRSSILSPADWPGSASAIPNSSPCA